MYGSRDSLWNAQSWPGLAARKIKAHVAIYNGSPFTNIVPRTYPAELVLAHQYTSSASIGGLRNVDANAFADNAFITIPARRKNDMATIKLVSTPNGAGAFDWWVLNLDDKTYWHVDTITQLKYLQAEAASTHAPFDVRQNQSADILTGFTLLPATAGTLTVDQTAAESIGAALGGAVKIPTTLKLEGSLQ